MKKLLIILTFLAYLPVANADERQWWKGTVAYNEGDYKTAHEIWEPLAKRGYAEAQLDIAELYRQGLGVSQDHTKAVKWYRKAAEQGQSEAQASLGIAYFGGSGVNEDPIYSYMWMFIGKNTNKIPQADEIYEEFLEDIAESLTSKDIRKAEELAQRCLKSNYIDCEKKKWWKFGGIWGN